ncbi:MAG: 4'-phosphopantetheinyl transferase superfamily protein [Rhodobacteraceae bacterium]|nr:4'-phosphopantetheinyl transferase superfamily protein [Paracoccaceae bacterium]
MTHGAHPTNRRQMPEALAADVFDPGLAVAWAEIARADPATLFDIERAAMRSAVPHRQREFTAGRIAARAAMGRDLAIPMADDRSPLWPTGANGSISHAGGWAIAIAGQPEQMLGVDLERDEPLPGEVLDSVLTPTERAWFGSDADTWARVIFSAKECAYKAQYPRSRQIFGFDAFEITLNPSRGSFHAKFQQAIAPFAMGDRLAGRFSRAGGYILTGIVA